MFNHTERLRDGDPGVLFSAEAQDTVKTSIHVRGRDFHFLS
ncbi:hypothetical protein [Pseudoramibacter alactolyticus]